MTDPRRLMPQQGTLAEGAHWLPIRVFFEDTDAGGIVYHANYLKFMERARSDFARVVGVDQAVMMAGSDRLAFVVRAMTVEFLRSARLDDALLIETRPLALKGATMEASQIVWRRAEAMTRATVRLACVDVTGRARRFPEAARAAFTPFLAPPPQTPAATESPS